MKDEVRHLRELQTYRKETSCFGVWPYKCPLPMAEMDGKPSEEERRDTTHFSLGSLRGRLPVQDFTACFFFSCQDILVDEQG